jgi:hypothetical protein
MRGKEFLTPSVTLPTFIERPHHSPLAINEEWVALKDAGAYERLGLGRVPTDPWGYGWAGDFG